MQEKPIGSVASPTLATMLKIPSSFLISSHICYPLLITAVASPSLSPAISFSNSTRVSSIKFQSSSLSRTPMNWIGRLGFGTRTTTPNATSPAMSSSAQEPDNDVPSTGQQFAQFGAGCFWGVELAFQRVSGVSKTEVGYSQGLIHDPTYNDVCSGTTNHSEIVRLQYDPKVCDYRSLLDVFWGRHDPTTPNRQGNDVGSQYRSGIYFYSAEQEEAARQGLEQQQTLLDRKIVTEILPAKKFYRAEEHHQQYLAKGGRFGFKQSTEKSCNDPIRCYG